MWYHAVRSMGKDNRTIEFCETLGLVGEPYLNHILEKQVHEALRQRITVHYNYEGLSEEEITEYICHKLALAGGSRALLEEGLCC